LEAENNFLEAEVYNKATKKRETLSKEKMIFEYRTSIIKKTEQYFIIKLVFDLAEKKEKYSSEVDNISFRETIQPKGNSGGSFFKNPSKEFSAGKLLEEV
jgi:UDP-N-acetylmuramate dehydrogenase